ncbi:MAG: GNAT family N-acetyltransferase [Gemmataceae bacterium]|nr:GNAT family N-acetyltransferase [Gemmataceae bacterium]
MTHPFTIAPANPDQQAAAFRLLFAHLTSRDCEARVANALNLIQTRELDPAGVLVAQADAGLVGAMISVPAPGASGLIWPPRCAAGFPQACEVEDALVQQSASWLRTHGAKLAQSLMIPEEAAMGAPLERNGFAHVTALWYLRHPLQLTADQFAGTPHLAYTTHDEEPDVFQQTLLRTYEQSQDCPEVTGVRTMEEVIAGHRAQGVCHPHQWLLARWKGDPAGVLILSETPESGSWDVSYVGVVPEARRHGVGRELMCKAMHEARTARTRELTLSVDARNQPAFDLYRRLGFKPFDRREVFLAVWR